MRAEIASTPFGGCGPALLQSPLWGVAERNCYNPPLGVAATSPLWGGGPKLPHPPGAERDSLREGATRDKYCPGAWWNPGANLHTRRRRPLPKNAPVVPYAYTQPARHAVKFSAVPLPPSWRETVLGLSSVEGPSGISRDSVQGQPCLACEHLTFAPSHGGRNCTTCTTRQQGRRPTHAQRKR